MFCISGFNLSFHTVILSVFAYIFPTTTYLFCFFLSAAELFVLLFLIAKVNTVGQIQLWCNCIELNVFIYVQHCHIFDCFSILNINACTEHIDLKGTAAVKCSSMRLKPLLATLADIAEALLLLSPESLAIAMLFVRHWGKKLQNKQTKLSKQQCE